MTLKTIASLFVLATLVSPVEAQDSGGRSSAPMRSSTVQGTRALHVVAEPMFAPEAPAATEDKALYYDVADILSGGMGPYGPTNAERLQATQDLVDVLLDVMDTRKRGLRSIVAKPKGQIVVTGAPAAHEYTRDFLAAQRKGPSLLALKLLLVEFPTGYLAELGIEGSSVTLNSESEYRALLKRIQSSEHVSMVTAPEIVFEARGRADLSVMSEVSYVADYVLQIVEPGSMEILDPVIETVKEGVQIEVRGVPVPGGVVQFDVSVNFSVLQRPIPTVKTRIQSGKGKEVEISLPEVDHIKLNSVITLPRGSAALISSAAPREGKDLAVIVYYAAPRAHISPRVQELFTVMRAGTYSEKWFPGLNWEDVPALLEVARSSRELTSFPTNPLSSQAMSSCSEGMIALWLIEGLQEEGHLPSLNPILIDKNSTMPFKEAITQEQQNEFQGKALAAYTDWWSQAKSGRVQGKHALEGSGLSWF